MTVGLGWISRMHIFTLFVSLEIIEMAPASSTIRYSSPGSPEQLQTICTIGRHSTRRKRDGLTWRRIMALS
ncbi:hypothetical protein EDB19DRAFT_1707872 [Suillus lakei]|nr:hypothetical protein EDB19DRAFT_1707872 [Suillus lakei]